MQQQMRSIEEARPPKHRFLLLIFDMQWFSTLYHLWNYWWFFCLPNLYEQGQMWHSGICGQFHGVCRDHWKDLQRLWPQRGSREVVSGQSWSSVSVACIQYVLLRYLTLVTCMGESIVRIAQEHGKTPQAVVKMENYHRLHATLSRLKIPVLDSIRWFSLVVWHCLLPQVPCQYM